MPFFPYVYNWTSGNTSSYAITDLMSAKNKIGLNAATSAFLIGDGASGIWQTFKDAIPDMKAFTSSGGKLIVSVGGASGPYLEPKLSIDQLASTLESVMNQTGCIGFDFDVEGSAIADSTTNDKRNKAIAILQKKYPNVYISYTIATSSPLWGSLTADALNLLKNAITNGVNINIVNGMIMDLYNAAAFNGSNWGNVSIAIIESIKSQLSTLWPKLTDAQLYAKIGATVMIGRNDDNTVFYPSDANILVDYAISKKLGLVSYWALQRDQANQSGGLSTSSMISQKDFDFYTIFKRAATTTLSPSVPVVQPTTPIPVVPVPVVPVTPSVPITDPDVPKTSTSNAFLNMNGKDLILSFLVPKNNSKSSNIPSGGPTKATVSISGKTMTVTFKLPEAIYKAVR